MTIKIGNRCVHIEHDDHDEVGASDTSWYNVEDGNDGNVVIAHHFTSSYDCIATRYTSISPDAAVLFATQLLAASVTLKGVDVPTDPDPALGHGVAGSGWDISELQDDDDLDPGMCPSPDTQAGLDEHPKAPAGIDRDQDPNLGDPDLEGQWDAS